MSTFPLVRATPNRMQTSSSELQAQNDDTLGKIYDNQDRIDSSREWLLQDKAGIAPRMFHFDMDSVSPS